MTLQLTDVQEPHYSTITSSTANRSTQSLKIGRTLCWKHREKTESIRQN